MALVVEPTCTSRALSRRDFVASGVVLGLEPGGTTGVVMTLMEIMVAIAIIVGVFGIAVPGLQGLFGVERAGMAKQIATTYSFLREEAGLRNVSFRITYDLDLHTWSVEVGGAGDLVAFERAEVVGRNLEGWEERGAVDSLVGQRAEEPGNNLQRWEAGGAVH